MDKLRRALSGQEQEEEEERGFVAQVIYYWLCFCTEDIFPGANTFK